MVFMRLAIALFLIVLLGGCRHQEAPLSGGRPVSHWVKMLRNPDPDLRRKAVTKLGNVGSTDAAALPAVLGALNDTDAAVRGEAILALMKFGPEADTAASDLARLRREDSDLHVRALAAKALNRVYAS